MSITSRPYTGADDLKQMLAMLAASIQAAGDCGYLHVGDVPHRLYNPQRRQPDPDPATYVRLWHDDDTQLIAFALLYPHWQAYDVQVHAQHRGGSYESQILDEVEQAILALLRKHNIHTDKLSTDGFDCDSARTTLLKAKGYTCQKQIYSLTERSLDEPIPEIDLPKGLTLPQFGGHQKCPIN